MEKEKILEMLGEDIDFYLVFNIDRRTAKSGKDVVRVFSVMRDNFLYYRSLVKNGNSFSISKGGQGDPEIGLSRIIFNKEDLKNEISNIIIDMK